MELLMSSIHSQSLLIMLNCAARFGELANELNCEIICVGHLHKLRWFEIGLDVAVIRWLQLCSERWVVKCHGKFVGVSTFCAS